MNRKFLITLTLVGATAGAGAALANSGVGSEHFDQPIMTDSMTMSEATIDAHFDRIDRNGDGAVTRAEMKAHGSAHRQASMSVTTFPTEPNR